jgi:threonine dehydrogenase-like Zn-dependent dehydrogenase
LRFEDGRVVLCAAGAAPPGAALALASVVSPGSEMRRMRSSLGAAPRDAGYITIARHPDNGALLVAPVPHGSWVDPDHPRVLTAPAGSMLEAAATARFQLIAALGLRHSVFAAHVNDAVVVGSGPVALGCCLELRRLGAKRVTLWTRRPTVPITALRGVEVACRVPQRSAHLVIDATGGVGRALRIAAPGSIVGLLGTPADGRAIPVDRIHRDGLTVIGMHELTGYDHGLYQATYDLVLAWLATAAHSQLIASWCLRIRPAEAESFYYHLGHGERPGQPIVLLEWS